MRSLDLSVVACILWLTPVALSAQAQSSQPSAPKSYCVAGEVNHRGIYSFPKDGNVTVLDALNAAGGQTPLANMKGVRIRRVESGKIKLISVDFEGLFKKGLAESNIPLLPGDIMFVPQRGRKMFLLADPFPAGGADPIAVWLDLRGLRISFLH